jgi:hypothetical protein
MGETIARKTVLARQRFRREAGSQSETMSRKSSAGRDGCWVDGCFVSIAPSTASMDCRGCWTMGRIEEEDLDADEVRSALAAGEMYWLERKTVC